MATEAMASDADLAAFRANALDIVGSWSVHDDDDGHLFYYNLETSEARWLVPDELRSLESEFMMKLMVDGAIARSGVWTAHDAGDGTLYYFNEKTRESVWEKPEQWGAEPVQHGSGHSSVPPPPPPPPPVGQKKPEPVPVKAEEPKNKKEKKNRKKKQKQEDEDEDEDEPVERVPPTAEEVERFRMRAEQAKLSQAHFRAVLRDKKIMPFCKWSVAFPQIATDPRFLAIPTMDERREIFEDFVKNRRDDIKSEKKQKLKDAKTRFAKLLRRQFKQQRERGSFDGKLSLSVFLATLEDDVAADEYKTLQEEVFAFLPISVQEKTWEKEMADYLEATKDERAQEAKLKAYLMEKLAGRGQFISWHDAAVQDAIKSFDGKSLVSESIQEAVVGQVAKAFSQKAATEAKRAFTEPRPDIRPREHAVPEPARDRDSRPRGDHYGGGDRGSRSQSTESRGRDHHGDESRSSHRDNRADSSSRHRRRSHSSSRSRSRSRGRSRHSGHYGSRHSSRRSRHDSRSSSRSRSGSRDSQGRSRSRRE